MVPPKRGPITGICPPRIFPSAGSPIWASCAATPCQVVATIFVHSSNGYFLDLDFFAFFLAAGFFLGRYRSTFFLIGGVASTVLVPGLGVGAPLTPVA